MSTVNKKEEVKLSGAAAGPSGNSTNSIITLLLDLSTYRGYNWGGTNRSAVATLRLRLAGLYGSSFTSASGEWLITVARNNNGVPTYAATAAAGNLNTSKLSMSISGFAFQVTLSCDGTGFGGSGFVATLDGIIADVSL